MTPEYHIQLLKEAAGYLLTPDIERGTIPNKSRILAFRLLHAADRVNLETK